MVITLGLLITQTVKAPRHLLLFFLSANRSVLSFTHRLPLSLSVKLSADLPETDEKRPKRFKSLEDKLNIFTESWKLFIIHIDECTSGSINIWQQIRTIAQIKQILAIKSFGFYCRNQRQQQSVIKKSFCHDLSLTAKSSWWAEMWRRRSAPTEALIWCFVTCRFTVGLNKNMFQTNVTYQANFLHWYQ